MWAEPRPRRIFAYAEPTDMRKSFPGLLAVVQPVFAEKDPYAASLFVFVNRGNLLKAIACDRTGFALYAIRLESGRFVFPSESTSQELSNRAFRFLLDGIPLGVRCSLRREGTVGREEFTRVSREALIAQLLAARPEVMATQTRLAAVEQQLRWFQQQLFGAKSERRFDVDPAQLSLGEGLAPPAEPDDPGTPVREHTRRARHPLRCCRAAIRT